MITALALLTGFAADLVFGDPINIIHPVQIIGLLIQKSEIFLRKIFPKNQQGEYAAGTVLVLIVALLSFSVPSLILYGAYRLNIWLYFLLQAFMFYRLIAVRSLKTESMKVYDELKRGDLDASRKAVSMIVGRDTQDLTFQQVTKAAVETVAESTSDGIIAPMFYMMLGGASLVYLYKAVNTMDSMIGYKNDKYLNFGRFAARTDDVFNYIPSRLAAWLMVAASYFLKYDAKNAYRVFKRDRYNHTSPNSAQTESVAAGALNIQLAGNAYYFGKLYEKPTIGDANRPIDAEDVVRMNKLTLMTSFLSIVLFALLRSAVVLCLL